MNDYNLTTINEQIAFVKKNIADKDMKAALLQSLEVLASKDNANDQCVIARLTKYRAEAFKEFLEKEIKTK